MPAEPNTPQASKPDNAVDTTKRYDVYCTESGRTVVYRDVLFRRVRTLFGSPEPYNMLSQVLELEQRNGQAVFINRHGLVRFCEHGTEVSIEFFSPK